ncbi:SIMPL domain-containing protein [Paenibacillus tarimensis]
MGNNTSDQRAYPSYTDKRASVEVVGEGIVTASPDRAAAVLGAVTEGPVLQTVQAENAAIVMSIINSMLNDGIPRENIQTYDFRIEIQYDYVDGKQIFRGYKVTHLLQITSDRVGQIGMLVDFAVSHGANTVAGVRFTMANPQYFQNQALAIAIQNARNKAATIANTLGVVLSVAPIQVEELRRPAETVPFQAAALSESAATPIQPGQLTVYGAVRMVYSY